MAISEDDKIAILESSITEQQRLYDIISNIYDQLRIKALALIAGEVAIVSFLFTNWDFDKALIGSDRTFFFFVGVIFLGLSLGALLWIISTVDWKMAHGLNKAKELFDNSNHNTKASFLEYLHDDYTNVNRYCSGLVGNKCRKFNWTVYLLAVGVIIIMVIKFGGPQ